MQDGSPRVDESHVGQRDKSIATVRHDPPFPISFTRPSAVMRWHAELIQIVSASAAANTQLHWLIKLCSASMYNRVFFVSDQYQAMHGETAAVSVMNAWWSYRLRSEV